MTKPIDAIIDKFGGLTPMARAMNHTNPTTVQGWRDRGNVPSRQIPLIIEAGRGRGIKLAHADFFEPPKPRRNGKGKS